MPETIREGMKMDRFSVPVDENFLATLPSGLKDDLIKDIEEYFGEGSSADCSIRVCPYCNVLSAFLRYGTVNEGDTSYLACTHCGGSNPFEKCRQTIKKAKILSDLPAIDVTKEEPGKENENKRVLQEQCIILLASGMEVFFSELYGVCMDVTFVRPEFSLYKKLTNDIFQNRMLYNDVVDQFKSELKMNLPALLGNDLVANLHLLALKRDAIVYKNGHADTIFLNRTGIKGKVGSRIPLSISEVTDFIKTSTMVIDILEKECGAIISTGTRDRIKTRLTRSLASLTFEIPVSRE